MVVASPITGAAIIGGELIISLPNGQIINCGLVQGPPGLKGEPGAPGPTGKAGLDGNTLLHGQGFPALDFRVRRGLTTFTGSALGSAIASWCGDSPLPKTLRGASSSQGPGVQIATLA